MVVIPAGEFEMGTSDDVVTRAKIPQYMLYYERPPHHVSIKPFAIGKYSVTRAEFAASVSETGKDPTGCKVRVPNTYRFFPNNGWRDPGFNQTDRDPVVCVSWDDAQYYVSWLNSKVSGQNPIPAGGDGPYRLVTEAEWEYAARSGTTTAWFWGDDPVQQCDFANGSDLTAEDHFPDFTPPFANCRDGYSETAPVGSFQPNPWGLYDMVGNVEQWIADCWNRGYSQAPADGSAWLSGECSKHVIRGGGWPTIPFALRSADRSVARTGERTSYTGFRVARTVQ
jgi:formylglycine-generating enzyme required for sulfatase activity